MNSLETYISHFEVQDQEIDLQNIVNNAAYLQYFDRARVQYLLSKGVDWEAWHHDGFNLVLIHVDMELKYSLKSGDKFYVKSSYEKLGRLRLIFKQEIYKADDDRLVAKAVNTLACIEIASGKPVMPEKLLELLFMQTK